MVTKLIVGLGNPGIKYGKNRHNVGFMVVDRLQTISGAWRFALDHGNTPWRDDKKFDSSLITITSPYPLLLVKPQTFMNDSGRAVGKIVNWYKIEPNDICVIHDDLDIPLGSYKIQKGKGPRLHYGVQSIEQALGIEDFWRIRVGVDNRKVAPHFAKASRGKQVSKVWRMPGEQYVLQDFTEDEQEVVDEVINKIVEELEPIIQ